MTTEQTGSSIDSTFSDGAPDLSNPQTDVPGKFTSEDIWGTAKEGFVNQMNSNGIPPTEGSLQQAPETNAAQDLENQSENADQTQEVQPPQQHEEPTFKPYEFKGKVYDSEVARTFESPEDLNKAISRGLASERLYKEYKSLQNELSDLRVKADKVGHFDQLAESEPEKLLELIFENHISEERAAEWTYNKYKAFHELAKMSPEERQNKQALQAAQKIIAQQKEFEQKQTEAAQARKQEAREASIRERRTWARTEYDLARAKYQGSISEEAIRDQIVAVLNIADSQERTKGKPLTGRERTALLNRYMKHFDSVVKRSNPSDKLGKATEEMSKQATNKLQTTARSQASQSQTAPKQQPQGKMSQDDVWTKLQEQFKTGKINLIP